MSPLHGSWKANLEKSKRHQNHQFHSAELTFEVAGELVTLTQSGINMAGKRESSTLQFHADGVDREVSPQAPGVVVATTWLTPRTLETIGRKDDTILGRGTYEVSEDAATLTATVSGIDASGAQFSQVVVFDRILDPTNSDL
jgi:hypothetical protein